MFSVFASRWICWLCWLGMVGTLATACNSIDTEKPQAESTPVRSQLPAVDTAIARQGQLKTTAAYTGTTLPQREVVVRSQVEGQILDLTVDVGDQVQQGQVLARLDDNLLTSEVMEAKAELAALQAEVTSLQAEVNDAKAAVERSRLELEQAQADANRSQQLYSQGAVTKQNLELAQTTVGTANQALLSAQQQVQNQLAAVQAAQLRVTAQQAIINRAQQRQEYATLTATIDGLVLQKQLEPGDLAQPGTEILRLGDLSQIKVRVQISELELSSIQLGQTAKVRLDALGDRTFIGKVSQISPLADATARLIPIEITIPNDQNLISSGLLARVSFTSPTPAQVIVPETAIQLAASSNSQDYHDSRMTRVFVVKGNGETATVTTRTVTVGTTQDKQVEIVSGLQPGEQFVIRSSTELQDGDRVRLSFISETL